MLLRHLPRESAYSLAVVGPAAQWGPVEHLLAIIADRVAIGPWQWANYYRKKGSPAPPFPEPLRRPGTREKKADRVVMRPGQLAKQMRKKGGK